MITFNKEGLLKHMVTNGCEKTYTEAYTYRHNNTYK